MSPHQISAPRDHKNTHGSVASYTVGFVASLILTGLSFGAIMGRWVSHDMALPTLVCLAVLQLLIQLVFFLHMGTAPEQRSDLAALVFTVLILATIVAGSLWVMHNANINMMPTGMSTDSAKLKP
ncbi:cytochrome o ubiquinol oxidase subunit IV [Asticcacaulis benevestitus]|uniref:Cytochrome bo(3) ubiquinol oxidase subunit 4 n=1 Tax=Asticcacaulis benevestitus DSM 16100 = ATCC BAA-896 TaxID=1121022 RepID=V4P609_9CAUL|nr:cytochrome o ubiquinol oxidase subunit IV [Asticcacaulis benevestitus]ESQ80695.1 hypothetical protein ABENE_22290 [Asticcacaulis benevestitus DSM 16100 = ATCC BAA-896]